MTRYLFTILLLLTVGQAIAQQKITEGFLVYKMSISNAVTGANETPKTEKGLIKLYLKGDYIREELELDNGYLHVQIVNYGNGTTTILNTINNVKYAIVFNLTDLKYRNSDYYNARYYHKPSKDSIAGNSTVQTQIVYKNGKTKNIIAIPGYKLSNSEIFDWFPEIDALPAKYDMEMNKGMHGYFELTKLDLMSVSSSKFRIPEDYTQITQKEYEQLIK